jgi:site-specific recombinase XerC
MLLDLTGPTGVLEAMQTWMTLGDAPARALVQRWIADQSRQGLAAATISRRLAALKFLAR